MHIYIWICMNIYIYISSKSNHPRAFPARAAPATGSAGPAPGARPALRSASHRGARGDGGWRELATWPWRPWALEWYIVDGWQLGLIWTYGNSNSKVNIIRNNWRWLVTKWGWLTCKWDKRYKAQPRFVGCFFPSTVRSPTLQLNPPFFNGGSKDCENPLKMVDILGGGTDRKWFV